VPASENGKQPEMYFLFLFFCHFLRILAHFVGLEIPMGKYRRAQNCTKKWRFVDFQNVDFQNVDFQNVDFQNVDFQNVDFQIVNFQIVNFQIVNFQNVNFQNVNIQNVKIQNVNIQNVNIQNVYFRRRGLVVSSPPATKETGAM
jgi:uncharacterized protein YjbI with pentapeptide repeats